MKTIHKVKEIIKNNLGKEELAEWWLLTINQQLRACGGLALTMKQMAQYFKMLKKELSMERKIHSLGDDCRVTFYKVNK